MQSNSLLEKKNFKSHFFKTPSPSSPPCSRFLHMTSRSNCLQMWKILSLSFKTMCIPVTYSSEGGQLLRLNQSFDCTSIRPAWTPVVQMRFFFPFKASRWNIFKLVCFIHYIYLPPIPYLGTSNSSVYLCNWAHSSSLTTHMSLSLSLPLSSHTAIIYLIANFRLGFFAMSVWWVTSPSHLKYKFSKV